MSATLTVHFELDGYRVDLALEGESGNDLLKKQWPQVRAGLQKLGAAPVATTNGNGGDVGQPEAKVCPIHHASMRKRSKHGETWWSHKAVDPDTGAEYWCRGQANGK